MNTSTNFICKCKKKTGWIRDGEYTMPCPICGRRYVGIYNKKELAIIAKVLKKCS